MVQSYEEDSSLDVYNNSQQAYHQYHDTACSNNDSLTNTPLIPHVGLTIDRSSGQTGAVSSSSSTIHNNVPLLKLLSALFYAVSSFLIVVVNKVVLTNYAFPSFYVVGLGQMVATIFILEVCRKASIVQLAPISRDGVRRVFPLPLFYIGNLLTGLGATKRLSLPMFTVLRRFTILMTALGEFYLLGVKQSWPVVWTIAGMIGGALVAAAYDLAYDSYGYFYVLTNDLFTSANGIYMKKKLDAKQLGKYALLYYNALIMIVPLMILTSLKGDWHAVMSFQKWDDSIFILWFFLSCVMGFVLMYSTLLCTMYNSPLTTTIVGCIKNVAITYVGMYLSDDYVFTVTNFLGVNISMIASLVYSYVTFIQSSKPTQNIQAYKALSTSNIK